MKISKLFSRSSVVLFALSLACASAPSTSASGELTASTQDTITAQDLGNTTATTLYDAIKEIRPDMLTGHNRGDPIVYVGKLRQPSGLDRLKQLRPNQASKVIYLKPLDAEHTLNEHTETGVLVVTMAE